MNEARILISHRLCPYVQRVAIALAEKELSYQRIHVDLANRPAWFERLSPLGRVPLLKLGRGVIFESAVILEYLEEAEPNPLHPPDLFERARHRAWIEFASVVLNDIASLYSAAEESEFRAKATKLSRRFEWVEQELGAEPWFAGERFSLVDAAFAPVFRYFDTFEIVSELGFLRGKQKIAAWRRRLSSRLSVRNAVQPEYPSLLLDFLLRRRSYLSKRMADSFAA